MLESYEAPAIDPAIDEALIAFIEQKKASMPDAFS
jgi:trimethylamine--corrinoid protein Co-methyltransferase